MAGWISMKVTLCESDEVERMKSALNLDTYEVVGRLQKIWSWAFLHTKKGGQSRLDCPAIDRKVDCEGFAQAMIDVGWGVMMSPGFKFKNFGKNNKTDHELRAEWAAKKRAQRIAREKRMSPECPQNVSGDKSENITQPDLTRPNHKYSSSSNGARTPTTGNPEPAAAAAAEASPSEEERQRVHRLMAIVRRRPEWMPEGKPWLDENAVYQIAMMRGLTAEVWERTLRAARDSRHTLKNPAGYFVAQIRKSCGLKSGGAA